MIENNVALWACPRSRSTVLARSFEQRSDCLVRDEPFYAAYLASVGQNHPGRDAIMGTQECDPERVAARLSAPLPPGKRFAFQKHITKNVLPEFGKSWFPARNIFLLRDPGEIVLSLWRVLGDRGISAEEIDIESLYRIFIEVFELTGMPPLVLHASDLIAAPQAVLERMCAEAGVPFEESMLTWPGGLAESSLLFTGPLEPIAGVWYEAVARSTHFKSTFEHPGIPDHLQWIVEKCEPTYQKLMEYCVRIP